MSARAASPPHESTHTHSTIPTGNERSTTGNTTFLPSHLIKLLNSPHTVTSTYAQSSQETTVQSVAEQLYGKHHHHSPHSLTSDESREHEGHKESGLNKVLEKLHLKKDDNGVEQKLSSNEKGTIDREHVKKDKDVENPAADQWAAMRLLSPAELQEVRGYGNWGGSEPSELFLNIYGQVLLSLETNPLNGMCSPPLMGSSGVIPLSIVSVIPDIIQHMADVIVRAEHEIFLATNYWEASGAAQTIVDAIRELSRRVIERKSDKIVLKVMYDRGNPSQFVHAHQIVPEKTYTGEKVKLPAPHEIPGIVMEVVNYHVPPVGTFHAKYMVVDRKFAILQSNNIQDRVNVEMMTHLEGPIVQSLYDMALLSWSLPQTPPLPLLQSSPVYSSKPDKSQYSFGKSHPVMSSKGDLDTVASKARETLAQHHAETEQPNDGQTMHKQNEVWDQGNDDEAERVDDQFKSSDIINKHLNTGSKIAATDTNPPPNAAAFKPIVLHSPHDPFPIAMVNRAPRGKPGHQDTYVPQDQAWLAAFKFAKKNVFIQTPTFNATPVVEAALEACRRGVLVEIYADLGFNDEGELLPYQGGTNQMVVMYMYSRLSESEKQYLKWYWYTGKDQKTPLNAKDKSRNCHVKIMIADEHIGIQGNGNQDTQSWFHSQEINILLDSPLVCKEWREAIDANQNTKHYGLVQPSDGVWRDSEGKELAGSEVSKIPHGAFKSLYGVKGAIDRVRGEGGF